MGDDSQAGEAGRRLLRWPVYRLLPALVIAALAGMAGVLAFAPTSDSPSDGVVAATDKATRTPTPLPGAPETSEPTPRPTPPPGAVAPGVVATGGDQPSGELPPGAGTLPENTADRDMLVLHDTLAAEIDDYVATAGAVDAGIAVTDLQTGETVSVNGNVLHKTGCTINIFAFFAAVSEFQAGNADPDDYAGLIKTGIGGSHPPEVKDFTQSIFGSYQAGVQRAQEMMTTWGMQVSVFDHIPYYGGDEPKPNILTALEMNEILAKLYHDQLFSPEWSGYAMGVLTDIAPYVQYILPKYLPSYATVAHKIGYFWDYDGWVNNDAGIVKFTGADGVQKAYAISYFSQRAGSERIGYSFGARLSRAVWEFMAPRYGIAPGPESPWAPPAYQPPPADNPPTVEPTAAATPEATQTPAPATTVPARPTPRPTSTPTPVPSPTTTAARPRR